MEQLDRAQRYLERLRQLYAGTQSDRNSKQECEDDALSFFVHCHHIKDWIIHLNKVGITSKNIDAFIDENECLRICADLCNGAKHCRLTKTSRSGLKPHLAGKQYISSTWLSGSSGSEIIKGKYTIVTMHGLIDALALAEECMACWTTYVQQLKANASLVATQLPLSDETSTTTL